MQFHVKSSRIDVHWEKVDAGNSSLLLNGRESRLDTTEYRPLPEIVRAPRGGRICREQKEGSTYTDGIGIANSRGPQCSRT